MNLLQETMNALKENGKTPADVRWVGRASGEPFIIRYILYIIYKSYIL